MKLLTTPDELGPCQVYCEQLKDEVRRLEADLAAERIENAHLRDAVQVFEKGYNEAQAEIAAAKEEWASEQAARGDFQRLFMEAKADISAARAVLESVALTGDTSYDHPPNPRVVVTLDRAAWLAWRERGK